jgi:hypothetical protein
MKTQPDAERFARYQSVVNLLLSKDPFHKPEIYDALEREEKCFIGRVITDLVRDGYLTESGSKSKPVYSWSEKKVQFNANRWVDQRVFTPTFTKSTKPWLPDFFV